MGGLSTPLGSLSLSLSLSLSHTHTHTCARVIRQGSLALLTSFHSTHCCTCRLTALLTHLLTNAATNLRNLRQLRCIPYSPRSRELFFSWVFFFATNLRQLRCIPYSPRSRELFFSFECFFSLQICDNYVAYRTDLGLERFFFAIAVCCSSMRTHL
jgi:hypothetical protein